VSILGGLSAGKRRGISSYQRSWIPKSRASRIVENATNLKKKKAAGGDGEVGHIVENAGYSFRRRIEKGIAAYQHLFYVAN